MRYLLIFLAGLLLGANTLYFALRQGWVPMPKTTTVLQSPEAIVARPAAPAQSAAPTATPAPAPTQSPAAQPGSREWWLARNAARQHGAPASQQPPAAVPPPAAAIPTPPTPGAPRPLLIPVQGITASQLQDTFKDARSENRVHDAIDIMAATGTPVYAVDDGRVVKLFNSRLGGITLYQFDPTDTYVYYYAHLDRYADGIAEGKQVKRGEVIGYVGYSGNANPQGPHLHFAVSVLGPEKQWWKATAINPYPLLTGKR